MQNNNTRLTYGHLDASYQAAGAYEGLKRLCDAFYEYMNSESQAKTIRQMHTHDLNISSEKLACFLSAWLGGPKLFTEKFGSIHIPAFHAKFEIGESEKEAWLWCMNKAIQDQPYEDDFKKYLIEQLSVPAHRILQAQKKP